MCARAVTGEAGGLELSAKRWRDIGGNRDAPRPARGIEGQCHIVVAAQLDKVRADIHSVAGDARHVAGRLLDGDNLSDRNRGVTGTVLLVRVKIGERRLIKK